MTYRYLITSPNEKAWKFDRPVIFLGDWCLREDRKHIWSKLDMIIAEPFSLAINERKNNLKLLNKYQNKIFPGLVVELNKIHNTKMSERSWKILIGDWFIRYSDVIYNRFKTLEQCFKKYKINGVTILINTNYNLATQCSYSSLWDFSSDEWNDFLYSEILLNHFNDIDLKIEKIIFSEKVNDKSKFFSHHTFLKRVINKFNKISFYIFGRNTDAFFHSTYLPKIDELKINFLLKQFPIIWSLGHSHRIKKFLPHNEAQRVNSSLSFSRNYSDKYEFLIKYYLFKALPRIYLEGFNYLKNIASKQNWPNNPRFIFTSNAHDSDDIFKMYTIVNIEKNNTFYYIGCHGSGFFSYYENPSNAEVTPDRYITWGWRHGLNNHVRGFVLKKPFKKSRSYNCKKSLILIQLPLSHRTTTWDNFAEYKFYLKCQFALVKKLKSSIRSQLIVRLHPSSMHKVFSEFEKWRNEFPSLKIDNGLTSFNRLQKSARLLLFGYDSTGFAQALEANIPTVGVLQVGFDQLNNFSKPYYLPLIEAGILHLSHDSAANKINEIWDDVDKWWQTEEVQFSRLLYCKQYARSSNFKAMQLLKLLCPTFYTENY